jgi:hypothetical protein
MYFNMKNILKSNRNHTPKQTFINHIIMHPIKFSNLIKLKKNI